MAAGRGFCRELTKKASLCKSPMRFDRDAYKKAKDADANTKPNGFWRFIPSGAFYIPKDKIVNLNISYEESGPNETSVEATRELILNGLELQVELSTMNLLNKNNRTAGYSISRQFLPTPTSTSSGTRSG